MDLEEGLLPLQGRNNFHYLAMSVIRGSVDHEVISTAVLMRPI